MMRAVDEDTVDVCPAGMGRQERNMDERFQFSPEMLDILETDDTYKGLEIQRRVAQEIEEGKVFKAR